MGVFRFKRFTVSNELSAMKVNTDGVLLGASMTLSVSDRRLLDVGTGTGTIALMAAQRIAELQCTGNETFGDTDGCQDARIVAIDIDKDSSDEAGQNFVASPWGRSLICLNQPLQALEGCDVEELPSEFDLIFSNPPYFESSLKAPDARRRTARHADTLSYRDIFRFAKDRLSREGRVSLILPAEHETGAVRHAASDGLYPFRIVRVRTVPRKAPSRVILEFSRVRKDVSEELLTIQDKGTYTAQYRSLVKDFLMI